MDRDQQAELRTKSVTLMNCMVQNGSVERQVLSDKDEEAEPQAVDLSASVSDCLRAGFEKFCDDIDKGLQGTERSYLLPWLLSTDEDVSIYEDVSQSEGNAITNPRMPMLVIECLAVLRRGADHQLLLDWLSILRGAMYLSDPINAGRASNISASISRSLLLADDGQKNQLIEARWGAFTGLSSILLAQAGDRTMLSWVQSKFNAIGCTHVALRLCSHENVAVQMQARLLLIALLECSNQAVQTEMAVYFETHKRCDFFCVAHEVLEAAKNSLKDHKRLLKHSTRFKFDVKKRARELAPQRNSATNLLSSKPVAFDGMVTSQSELLSIGRDSHVMVLLRQLELMCSAQHAGLQDLMQKQSSTKSYNLLRACTLLVRAVQGLEMHSERDQDLSRRARKVYEIDLDAFAFFLTFLFHLPALSMSWFFFPGIVFLWGVLGCGKPLNEQQPQCIVCYIYIHTCMHACMHAYIHIHINVYIHLHLHACMHACMHAYTYKCIHTYTYT
jgi:hypothetical protein